MKKYFVYTLLIGSLLSGTACKKDLLDQQAPDRLATDNFWTSKERALTGLSAAYSQLESFTGWDNYVEARAVREYYREDYVMLGSDAYNYAWWTELFNFNFNAGNYAIDLLWRDHYTGINYANQLITRVPAMTPAMIDDASRKEIMAEGRFLRAYYYFRLICNFEQLVLRDKVPAGEGELDQPLATRAATWDFIIADLKAAIPDLPLRSKRPGTELGRVTRGAAQAYLGKVLLYRAGEDKANATAHMTEAGKLFEQVVASAEYSLSKEFTGMFNGTFKNSTESLFELQQSADETNGSWYKSYLSDWVAASELGGYGEIYGTQQLVDEMKKEGKIAGDGLYDHRLYGTVFFNDPYFNDPANPRVYGKNYDDYFDNNAIAFRKWIPASEKDFGSATAINIPLMRYADVLLMYAEVLNETGQSAKAVQHINTVRARAGMPALSLTGKQDIFNQIIHERTMEFTMESSRFYDLRRWGLLEQRMKAAGRTFTMDKAFFPLPEKEVLNNGGIGK